MKKSFEKYKSKFGTNTVFQRRTICVIQLLTDCVISHATNQEKVSSSLLSLSSSITVMFILITITRFLVAGVIPFLCIFSQTLLQYNAMFALGGMVGINGN